MYRALASIVMLGFLVSCAPTVPFVAVERPWTRTLASDGPLSPSSEIGLRVSGTVSPLIGDSTLLCSEMSQRLEQLLQRRGMRISTAPKYLFHLHFKTERVEEFESYNMSSSSSKGQFATKYKAGVTTAYSGQYGLGVMIASTVAGLASTSQSYAAASKFTSYVHTFALEIADLQDHVIWKGESLVRSPSVDNRIDLWAALQVLLSGLPTDNSIAPAMDKLKPTHIKNFYKEYCRGRWFVCPALPYRIKFPPALSEYSAVDRKKWEFIEDVAAMPTFYDLIQTAEYALPTGKGKIKDPTEIGLWSSVLLFRKYTNPGTADTLRAVIAMDGSYSGYTIRKCWLASLEEYSKYQTRMDAWQTKLQEYYDMFEHPKLESNGVPEVSPE